MLITRLVKIKFICQKLGEIKIVWSRPLASQATSVTIIRDSAGRPSIASFVVETCIEHLPKTDNLIGIDLGISTFATVGTFHATSVHGEKFEAPKPLKQNLKKLAKFQIKFAKTEPGSKCLERRSLKIV